MHVRRNTKVGQPLKNLKSQGLWFELGLSSFCYTTKYFMQLLATTNKVPPWPFCTISLCNLEFWTNSMLRTQIMEIWSRIAFHYANVIKWLPSRIKSERLVGCNLIFVNYKFVSKRPLVVNIIYNFT